MMKNFIVCFVILIALPAHSQNFKQQFVSDDITNFWMAYENIQTTTDSTLQYQYINELYINKATDGLKALMHVRNYTAQDFVENIMAYPNFWKSLKPSTLHIQKQFDNIEADILKLKTLYPDLKPSTIYFSIGDFRTGGTAYEDRVLIGSELSLADDSVIVSELPERLQNYFKTYKPNENLALTCTHEYIHTQQKELINNLLSKCLYEGIAEFVSCKATEKPSSSPAIEFGKAHQNEVVEQFVKDLFIMSNDSDWLWGENTNHLKERDLGYHIGYEIAERYYHLSNDKKKAIKDLIELDYTDEKAVEAIIDVTEFLPKTLNELYEDYELERPKVTAIQPFKNGSKKVKPGITKITITFSEPLNGYNTGIDFGPLGKDCFPKLRPNRVWSEDYKSITIEAELQPNKTYQFVIDNTFRKENGIRLKPYLIEFSTKKK